MSLNERDRALLDFERSAFQIAGPKYEAIRCELGLSSTRYYQLLNRLIDHPDAYAFDPLLVKRLRARRDQRRRRRFLGREVDPRQR